MSGVFGEEGVEEGLIWPTNRRWSWVGSSLRIRASISSRVGRLCSFCALVLVYVGTSICPLRKGRVLGPAITGLGYLLYAVDHLVC